METIRFKDQQEKIISAIKEKLHGNPIISSEGGFTIIEGFFNQPFQDDIADKIVIGGKTVPMVAIVGNKTGRMYFFALKALLPGIEI